MSILTKGLVQRAIELALPTVRLLVKEHTWGPPGVVIAVDGKGLEEPVIYVMEELGPEADWEKRWGEGKNFRQVALEKLRVAARTGLTSRAVTTNHPWLLEEGDSLYIGAVT